MRKKTCFHKGNCPECGESSDAVKEYKTRQVSHYRVGGMETLSFPSIVFRCSNEACKRKTFTYIIPTEGLAEVVGKSRYSQSSKKFVANKMLKKQTSYQSFCQEIKEDFGGRTAYSSLHRWTQETKVTAVPMQGAAITVLHSDEKHPSKKKRSSDKEFVIATAGRAGVDGVCRALHANLADSNDKEALDAHYKSMITNGLDAEKVELVVTDMLSAYEPVIANNFPNAEHQYCIFHFLQAFNRYFKEAMKDHRATTFEAGARKEAHRLSFLLLKGQEKLTDSEREMVQSFCIQHPTVEAAYALKEDIRTLYASVETPVQAYAYRDILLDTYAGNLSETMQKALTFFQTHFEKTIAFLRKGYFHDRTNNDAERMMRKIKRIQQTHYFLRKSENYIKKICIVLGIQTPFAA